MVKPVTPSEIYNEYYYRHDCGAPYERSPEWLNFFAGIAEKITQRINPGSVLDAGCAMGFLVEGLRERGVEAFGLDISDYAIQKVHENIKSYCQVGSVLDPLPRRYDLIVCIEVFEHLQPNTCEQAIENLCKASDDILFSSTPMDYYEITHFNVQPPDYWADLFAIHGFVRDVDFDASFITPWAVRFRRNNEQLHQIVRNYERKFWLLWKESQDTRRLALDTRNQITIVESKLAEKERELVEKERELVEKKRELVEKEHELVEIDQNLVEKISLLQEKEKLLQAIYISRAWRLIIRMRHFKERLNNLSSIFSPKTKNTELSMLENVNEITPAQMINRSVLLEPLIGFSVPYSQKRINLILDELNDRHLFDDTATAVVFAVLLAEKWQCELRIITRLEMAQKSTVSHILKLNEISAPNIDFLFVQAGNPKMDIPVGSDEIFLVISWTTVVSIKENFDSQRIIYLLQEDERNLPHSKQNNVLCDQIMRSAEVQFVIKTRQLYDHFVSEGYENMRNHGVSFEPSFSDTFFFREEKELAARKIFLFHAENKELLTRGVDAINMAISKGVLDLVAWDYYFVGHKSNQVIRLGNSYVPSIPEYSHWRDYPKFLQRVDLGLCLTEVHNAVTPVLEWAASGAVVVTNFTAGQLDLSFYSRNIIHTNGDPSTLFDQIGDAVELVANMDVREKNFQDSLISHSWKNSLERALSQIKSEYPNVYS